MTYKNKGKKGVLNPTNPFNLNGIRYTQLLRSKNDSQFYRCWLGLLKIHFIKLNFNPRPMFNLYTEVPINP